jgi:hypothetical protein
MQPLSPLSSVTAHNLAAEIFGIAASPDWVIKNFSSRQELAHGVDATAVPCFPSPMILKIMNFAPEFY